MGRHRFEDQFKGKLSDREIKPSEGSWDKLSGQLNTERKKPVIWWVGIAATLLGAIFITSLVYNTNYRPDAPIIVEAPVEVENEDAKESIIEEAIAAEENIVPVSPVKVVLPTMKNETTSQQVKSLPEEIAIAGVNEENLPLSTEEMIAYNDEKISKKLEEIIAEVSLKDSVAGDHTNDEIEALLYKAASEISLERSRVSSTGTVDAGDLLFTVEMELEESFREKVFDILKESFLKARTAVANRNY